MKLLFQIALQNRKHYGLLFFTFLALIGLTLSSQLELASLGIMSDKGADFFQLFSPLEEGRLVERDFVLKEDLLPRFQAIDQQNSGVITAEECQEFLASHKKQGWFQSVFKIFHTLFNAQDGIQSLILFLLSVSLLKAGTLFFHRYATRLVAIRVSRDLRQQYFEHIQSLPMSFYQKFNSGSLSSRAVTDAALVADAINAALINYLQTPLVLITSLTLCFLSSWRLSLIIFCGLPLIMFPIMYLSNKVRILSRQVQKNQENFASIVLDFLSGVQTVKMFAMEDFSLNKYREQNLQLAKYEERGARYDSIARPIIHMIAQFFLVTAVLYGLYVEAMTISEILVYCALLYCFYEPIKKFGEENIHIQRGISAAERMYEVLNIASDIQDDPEAKDLTQFQREISFENLSFRYNDEWVLKNLSFTIKKGQKVAICGSTGAGKSTIAQLLSRLYDPQEGQILIDNLPIKLYTQKSLREMIAVVPQKPFLFLDTIAANISYGRPFTRQEIITAAKKAHADEFIALLPEGYDTLLQESGKNLSGGQQQRLAIARALVKKSSILLLDEATSSLDAISESLIRDALSSIRHEVTQIVIAHRLSTIEDADKILFIDRGQKIAEGTKDELLASCEPFRHMWNLLHT